MGWLCSIEEYDREDPDPYRGNFGLEVDLKNCEAYGKSNTHRCYPMRNRQIRLISMLGTEDRRFMEIRHICSTSVEPRQLFEAIVIINVCVLVISKELNIIRERQHKRLPFPNYHICGEE